MEEQIAKFIVIFGVRYGIIRKTQYTGISRESTSEIIPVIIRACSICKIRNLSL